MTLQWACYTGSRSSLYGAVYMNHKTKQKETRIAPHVGNLLQSSTFIQKINLRNTQNVVKNLGWKHKR